MEWNIEPQIVSFGALQIRYYGLLFALGFILGYRSMVQMYTAEGRSTKDLDLLLYMLIGGTLIGARLGHCLFYEPDYFLANPIEILYVWRGGLASHGGATGVLIAIWWYTRLRPDQPVLWLMDRLAYPIALTGAFIRLGNFFNSEILGKPADVPWAIRFTRVDDQPRHPSMLYESAAYFGLYLFLRYLMKKFPNRLPQGLIPGIFLVWVFLARFLIEFTKENQEAWEAGMVLNMGQLLSIPMILLGLGFIYYAKKHPRPAMAATVVSPPASRAKTAHKSKKSSKGKSKK